MNNIILQIIIIVGILIFLTFLIILINKKSFSLRYSLIWFFALIVMLIISIYPKILMSIAMFFGFEIASNALFSVLFFFVISILVSVTSIISKQSERIKSLTQTIALLEKRIRELEEKNDKQN
jgi:hypothetical protein